MNPKLQENIEQIRKSILKINENCAVFISEIEMCDDQVEETLLIAQQMTNAFNNIILMLNTNLKKVNSLLIDSMYINNPEAEKKFKIKFNKRPENNTES